MNKNSENNMNESTLNESYLIESKCSSNENKETGMNSTAAMKKKGKSVSQSGDVNSKRIFEDPYLCAQFLREYSGLDLLKDVRPEDIEPVKLRYHIFEDTEMGSDSVVRVRQETGKAEPPLYIVPLIDHKSQVDYNVGMQLLYYMVCIWRDWEKEMKQKYDLNPRAKDFRYPFVYPIVYYEGTENWTAPTNLGSRIAMSGSLPQYVPDFQYHVIRIHDYTNAELLNRNDEMSLLMLLNKIQRAKDLNELKGLLYSGVDRVVAETPANVLDIIAGTARSLCRKLNIPEDETNDYIASIRKERKMGYLFENMEKIDIQEERRLREEAQENEKRVQEELKRAQEKVEALAKHAEEIKAESALRTYIETLQEFALNRTEARDRLVAKYALGEAEAEEKLSRYWKE